MRRFLPRAWFGLWFPVLLMALGAASGAAAQAQKDPGQHFFSASFGDLRQDLEDARQEGKRGILLVFESQDCPYCLRMHQTVLNRVEVQGAFRQHFIPIKVGADSSQPLTGLDGRQVTGKEFARQHKVFGTPFSLAFGTDGQEIGRLPGAPIDAGEYLAFRDYLLAGGARLGSFAQFKARPRGR